MATAVMLHNIRSAYNVGAILRTAEAAGVTDVWITGYTPAPVDRHGRKRRDIAKTALGAEYYLSWQHIKTPRVAVHAVRRKGYTLVGVEQDERSVNINEWKRNDASDICFLFGNEVRGLSPQQRHSCDALVEIPQHGRKASLNVAVAAGIVLYCGCGR